MSTDSTDSAVDSGPSAPSLVYELVIIYHGWSLVPFCRRLVYASNSAELEAAKTEFLTEVRTHLQGHDHTKDHIFTSAFAFRKDIIPGAENTIEKPMPAPKVASKVTA